MRVPAILSSLLFLIPQTSPSPIGSSITREQSLTLSSGEPCPVCSPRALYDGSPTANVYVQSARSKRVTSLINVGKGWVAYVESFESFIPIQVAAAVLTNFYISAYNHVQNIRGGRTPQNYYACELDNLILEFFSADKAIPWDFVTTFMSRMANHVSRGFTGKFIYLYVHMPTGVGVRVSLEVVNVASAA